MCEINPKHSAYFKLEVYTTNPRMSEERFLKEVSEKLLAIEMLMNEDMRFRFHIHEDKKSKLVKNEPANENAGPMKKVKHDTNKRTK